MDKIFEKLGIFYLGKNLDPETLEATEGLTLVKSKIFTTHAAIIGMTGSGKTGLGIDILEEAALDNIPVIVIDPKGDMGNLCLAFDDLSPEAFEPWIEEEANVKGVDVKRYAEEVATRWKEGIESFGQDLDRIRRFKAHESTIYTPGSKAGVPVNVLGSLNPDDETLLEDADAFASAIQSTVASLMSLLSIEADPLESREFILIAQILKQAWLQGEPIDMAALITRIITPPFKKIGILPLESFYPAADRFKLAARFNNILANPTFSAWLEGAPLSIEHLLYDENQRSKISIFSIAHLSDAERMFFVTMLLNRTLGWMRRQSGTSRLRVLLYMDEIYGYFPPSKNPPSKEPMMQLLKQARAFGVGMVLSTQNPVDLDYKGLSNIGTWFIGRLQTKQDVARVIDGIGTKIGDHLGKDAIKRLIASLPKRTFLLSSAHLDRLQIFQTRWVLSYLRGPLKKRDIARLMSAIRRTDATNEENESRETDASTHQMHASTTRHSGDISSSANAPLLSTAIPQRFAVPTETGGRYLPQLAAKAQVRILNAPRNIDRLEAYELCLPLSESSDTLSWQEAHQCDEDFARMPVRPAQNVDFAPLPSAILAAKNLKPYEKMLKEHLYATTRLTLWRCRKLKAESHPGESYEAFKSRLMDRLEEKKEEATQTIEARYAKKLQALQDRYARALRRVEKERSDVQRTTTASLVDVGMAIFGAFLGGKRSAASKVGQAIKGGGRMLKEKEDVARAEAALADIERKIERLKDEMQERLDVLEEKYSLDNYPIETFFLKPRRSDIVVEALCIFWRWEG